MVAFDWTKESLLVLPAGEGGSYELVGVCRWGGLFPLIGGVEVLGEHLWREAAEGLVCSDCGGSGEGQVDSMYK